jgi:hypothetical protein
MTAQQRQKPGVEEWLHWAEVILDRLTDCVHLYKKPPATGGFMPDIERQQKSEKALNLLHRLHALVDKSDTPSDSIRDVHSHDEQIIDGFAVLFRETLRTLPQLSEDIQKLLKSPWQGKFTTKIAQTLFAGAGDESQGIGSGHPEHGRLPEALFNMLEREEIGDIRRPREALLRTGEPRRHDTEGRDRWSKENAKFLRTAGRIE